MSDDQHMISKKALLQGVLGAAALAAVALVTVILPAEYGIDPIGAGKMFGLDKIAATDDGTAVIDKSASVIDVAAEREDEVVINIAPDKGLEYKLHMMPGAKLQHSWTVEDGDLYFDFHGEPQGDTTGYFESFTISTASDVSGLFYAPFEGSHGWYWKNKSDRPLVIKLKTKGNYNILGLKQ
jgi:hypothetical protein